MSGGFFTLLEAAAKFEAVIEDFRTAPEQIVERACQMVEDEAKGSLGSYHRGWKQLAQSTQTERVREGFPANEPGLRTGAMRDSIEHEVHRTIDGAVGHVGSNDDKL